MQFPRLKCAGLGLACVTLALTSCTAGSSSSAGDQSAASTNPPVRTSALTNTGKGRRASPPRAHKVANEPAFGETLFHEIAGNEMTPETEYLYNLSGRGWIAITSPKSATSGSDVKLRGWRSAGEPTKALTLKNSDGFDPACDSTTALIHGREVLIVPQLVVSPAEGINAPSTMVHLVGFDENLTRVSDVVVAKRVAGIGSCEQSQGGDAGSANTFTLLGSSVNGSSVVFTLSPSDAKPNKTIVADPQTGDNMIDPDRSPVIFGNTVVGYCGSESDYIQGKFGIFCGMTQGVSGRNRMDLLSCSGSTSCNFKDLQDGTGLTGAAVGGAGNLTRFDIASQKKLWTSQIEWGSIGQALPDTHSGLIIIAVSSSSEPSLSAVDSTGKKIWSKAIQTKLCGVRDGRALVAVNGQLAVIDTSNGEQLEHLPEAGCPALWKNGYGQPAGADPTNIPIVNYLASPAKP